MRSVESRNFLHGDSREEVAATKLLIWNACKFSGDVLCKSANSLRKNGGLLVWRQDCKKDDWVDHVYSEHDGFRTSSRALMNHFEHGGHHWVVDRHKQAALMLVAVLQAEPLDLTDAGKKLRDDKLFPILDMPNEILAFKAAIRVLGFFAGQADGAKPGTQIPAAPTYPPTVDGDGYEFHAYRALRFARQKYRGDHALHALAHWMFYIENYWRTSGAGCAAKSAQAA